MRRSAAKWQFSRDYVGFRRVIHLADWCGSCGLVRLGLRPVSCYEHSVSERYGCSIIDSDTDDNRTTDIRVLDAVL